VAKALAYARLPVRRPWRKHTPVFVLYWHLWFAPVSRGGGTSACSLEPALPVETFHPHAITIAESHPFSKSENNASTCREHSRGQWPCPFISRSIRRCVSFFAMASRLSYSFLPLAKAISTFARFCLRYMRRATIVKPFSWMAASMRAI